MPTFYPARVGEVRRETADCVSVRLDVAPEQRAQFDFQPGQFLTLRATIGGEDVRRSYSICAAPAQHELRVAVKRVAGGRFSTYANEHLAVGDTLEVMPPSGRFVQQAQVTGGLHVAFVAGSGITPVMSILRHTLTTEPDSRFLLLYGNSGYDSIIFREELEALKNNHLWQFGLYHLFSREDTGSPLLNGRITGEKVRQMAGVLFDPEQVDAYYICGPEAMLLDVRDTLIDELGVDRKKVHFELFGTGQASRQLVDNDRPDVAAEVTVRLDGKQITFGMADARANLLDAALRNGFDLPFACKGGVCSTCRAKLVQGEVEMAINYALEPEELAAGYILTCQAHPKSEQVEIDFDT